MFLTKMSLPRRTFLRGVGATLGLPLLDAMVPAATALAQTAARPPRRFAAAYSPNGMIMSHWTPAASGTSFDLPLILKPLEAFRDQLVVVSGLNAGPQREGGHALAQPCWLTGILHPKQTEGYDLEASTTIDQVLATQYGNDDAVPLARDHGRGLHDPGRLVRGRLQLRLPEHHLLAHADAAAADGAQPAARLRAHVRRRARLAASSAPRACATAGACSTWWPARPGSCRAV